MWASHSAIARPTAAGGIRFGGSSVAGGSISGRRLGNQPRTYTYLDFATKLSVTFTALIGGGCENQGSVRSILTLLCPVGMLFAVY